MFWRLTWILVAVGVIAATAWALWPRPVPVETAPIDYRPIAVTVEDEGMTRIREVFTVSAPIAGELVRLNLHAGDPVVAHQTVVASIRPAEPSLLDARSRKVAEAALEAARAAVDLANAQVLQAQAQLGFLEADLERAKTLVARGSIAERTYQKAELDVSVGKAQVQSAQSNLMVRQRELESAQAALLEGTGTGTGASQAEACCTDLRSPATGTILRVLNESEQVVAPGTPLLEIGDPNDIEAVVDVLSRDAVRIAVGAPATIDGWGGPPLRAEVARIDPAAVTKVSALGIEEQRVTVVFKLLDPPSDHQRLGHGFRIVGRVVVWKGDHLVAVPTGALFRTGTDWAAFIVENGVARLKKLELGERNADYAQVISGLEPGMAVILHPNDSVLDGASVAPS